MFYRRNADSYMRDLERKLATGDQDDFRRYLTSLFRSGYQPYWFRIREVTCRKDELYADRKLKENDPVNFLPWEQRGPSLDRKWLFYLHIPMIDETEMIVGLGQMTCFESSNGAYLEGCVEALRDWFLWDNWSNRDEITEQEISRSNWALSSAITSAEGRAGQTRAHFNVDVPLGWTPEDLVDPRDAVALNWNPPDQDPDEIRPYDSNAQRYREGDPLTLIPPGEFLVQDYLFNLFYEWLGSTQIEYGIRLRNACYPLNKQLSTIYQNRHIWLYYWKKWDRVREVIPDDRDPYGHRFVYDVAYGVAWYGGQGARFWRWDHDDGHDGGIHHSLNALSRSVVVQAEEPEEAHIAGEEKARRGAWEATQKKMEAMIDVAEYWRYKVYVIEGEPPQKRSYISTWKAGMSFSPGNRELEHFR